VKKGTVRRTVIWTAVVGAMSAAAVAPAYAGGKKVSTVLPAGTVSVAGAGAFRPLDRRRIVPGNVLAALRVPEGAEVIGRRSIDRDHGFFNRVVLFRDDLPASTLSRFFPAALARAGWTITAESRTAAGGREVLATHPGDDGYYWEIGVVIGGGASLNGSAAPAGGGITSGGANPTADGASGASGAATLATSRSTSFSMDLMELPDPD
jgi:hypothetical protein